MSFPGWREVRYAQAQARLSEASFELAEAVSIACTFLRGGEVPLALEKLEPALREYELARDALRNDLRGDAP